MLVLFLLQIILIALNAVFACAEIAVLSINETKLERMADQGDKRARRLFRLTRESDKRACQVSGNHSGCHHIVWLPGFRICGG